jgi:hypothetical protein
MSHISGWVTYLDESHICMSNISRWVTYLDESHIWMSHISGWVTYLDESRIWMSHISGWVTYLDESHIWMSRISGWVTYLDESHIWMSHISGWIFTLFFGHSRYSNSPWPRQSGHRILVGGGRDFAHLSIPADLDEIVSPGTKKSTEVLKGSARYYCQILTKFGFCQ